MRCQIGLNDINYTQATKVDGKWIHYGYYNKVNKEFRTKVTNWEDLLAKLNIIEKEEQIRIKLLTLYTILNKEKLKTNDNFSKDIAIFSVYLYNKYPNCLNVEEWYNLYQELISYYIESYKESHPIIEKDWREIPTPYTTLYFTETLVKRDWIISKEASPNHKTMKKEFDRLKEVKRCISEIWGV